MPTGTLNASVNIMFKRLIYHFIYFSYLYKKKIYFTAPSVTKKLRMLIC
jgi:hypothetical protein